MAHNYITNLLVIRLVEFIIVLLLAHEPKLKFVWGKIAFENKSQNTHTENKSKIFSYERKENLGYLLNINPEKTTKMHLWQSSTVKLF